jgi:nucleobase:cation symporter-1, NCS1 family
VGEAGLVVIVVGNVFYLLTGLASLQGLRAGTTTFAISRAPFGPNGNRVPSFLNWITQVGLEIEGIAFIVLAAIAVSGRLGFLAGTPVKVIFILVAVAIQAVLPTLGHAAVLKVLRWLAIPFVVLFAISWGSSPRRESTCTGCRTVQGGAVAVARPASRDFGLNRVRRAAVRESAWASRPGVQLPWG